MGLRGPAPTPTKILAARGSWLAKTRNGEPEPERGKPAMPCRLTKPQRAVWRKVCGLLDGMGVLTVVDGGQLERYVTFFCRWRDCEDFIARQGMTHPIYSDDPSTYVVKGADGRAIVGFGEYPQVKESHRLDTALKQIEVQFGLTPSARARLCSAESAKAPADPLEAYRSA